ncbi:MAG: FliA/WhiG family RNA polymerase sigma factor [Vampirovibrio sp.]
MKQPRHPKDATTTIHAVSESSKKGELVSVPQVPARADSIRKAVMAGGAAKAASDVVTIQGQGIPPAAKKAEGYLMVSTPQQQAVQDKEKSDKAKEKAATNQRIQELWQEYAKDRTNNRIREKLVLHYLHLVKHTVNRLPLSLPNSVSPDDIISYGTLGLLDAIKRFEPERGWKFETFAVNRIRGEVIDQLRVQDWVPRGVRKRNKKLAETLKILEEKLHRPPTDEEMAAALEVTVTRYHAMLNEASVLVLSLDETLGSDKDSNMSLLDTVADKHSETPEGSLEVGDVQRCIAEAITHLPERERLLIALYYQEHMTLSEIGELINISESRVCQLHAQAIMRLRNKLSHLRH